MTPHGATSRWVPVEALLDFQSVVSARHQSGDRGPAPECGLRPLPVVVVEPAVGGPFSPLQGLLGDGVRPRPKRGTGKARCFAVGLRAAGLRLRVPDAQPLASGSDGVRSKTPAVVSHHPLHAHTAPAVVGHDLLEEPDRVGFLLIAGHCRQRDSRAIVDRHGTKSRPIPRPRSLGSPVPRCPGLRMAPSFLVSMSTSSPRSSRSWRAAGVCCSRSRQRRPSAMASHAGRGSRHAHAGTEAHVAWRAGALRQTPMGTPLDGLRTQGKGHARHSRGAGRTALRHGQGGAARGQALAGAERRRFEDEFPWGPASRLRAHGTTSAGGRRIKPAAARSGFAGPVDCL